MDRDQLKATFDQQASSYDQKWSRLAAFRESLHLLVGSAFAELPANARVLCVGAGTGAEVVYLAGRFPGWTFTAVEPSAGMLGACRKRAEELGIAPRCTFHEGYLESLPTAAPFDAATCFLVSQFILDERARAAFFGEIAQRLRPGGMLASSDLSGDTGSAAYESLLQVWLKTITGVTATPENIAQMLAAYRSDVAVLPAPRLESLIASAGFEPPVPFFQAGLIRAWFSRRAGS